jgi:hypothetical protein
MKLVKYSLLMGAALMAASSYAEVSIDAELDYEGTAYFNEQAATQLNPAPVTQKFNNSVSVEAEIYTEWADGTQSLTFKPFYRYDEMDDERTHGDIRELMWHQVADEYELKAGIGKVFWGVTESAHLVDIVNQTDSVESLDGEEKLGQPMVQLLIERDWGNLDLFALPYHRERTFAGEDARLGTGIKMGDAIYESDDEENNIDLAARFYSYIDDFEYAISAFHGNSREPVLGVYSPTGSLANITAIQPYYPTITQVGLEVQYLIEGWAWKLEAIHRDGMIKDQSVLGTPVGSVIGDSESYFATVAGFEYTQVGIFESRWDLGWVAEHLYDSRQEDASFGAFEHDVLLGTRWVANDEASSELLAGILYDYEYEDYSLSLEGNTRIMDGVSLDLEARIFAPDEENPQFGFRDEDFVKLTLTYYL